MLTKSKPRLLVLSTMSRHSLARYAKLHKCMMRTEIPLLPIVQIEYIVLN